MSSNKVPIYDLTSPGLPKEFEHIYTIMMADNPKSVTEVHKEYTQNTLYDSENLHDKFIRLKIRCFCSVCYKNDKIKI